MGRLQGDRFSKRTATLLIMAVSVLMGFLLGAIVFGYPNEVGEEVAEPVVTLLAALSPSVAESI
jgi:hypothetical protein